VENFEKRTKANQAVSCRTRRFDNSWKKKEREKKRAKIERKRE